MKTNARQRNLTTRQSGVARRWLLAALLVAGAGAAWWAWSPRGHAVAKDSKESAAANRVQPVSVAVARRQDIRVTVNAIGTIAAANTAIVRARVDGELKALHFKEGQLVRAGQLLAEIDSRSFQIALAQAEGVLARDQAQLQNAKLDVERFRDLLSKDAIAKQQVDTQEALIRQLQGTVQADQAQVDNAKLQLSYTRITAPISGLAGLKQIDLGNNVRASDANGLLSITQTQPVNVVFTVPDIHLPRIRHQLKAGKALRVEAWDRDQKMLLAEGEVATVDNAIDAATGTIKLKASFPNADGGLFPNQFVNVRLQLDTLDDALAVPGTALMRSPRGNYVYLVNADSSVTIRGVLAGESDGSWVSVHGNLKPGDKVVTDGTDRLRDGAKVEVIAQAPSAAADAGSARPSKPASAATVVASAASSAASAASSTASASPTAAAQPKRSAAGAATSAPKASASQSPAAGERPAWVDRLPPEAAERVMKMSPAERQAWLNKRIEERAREAAATTTNGDRPAWMDRVPPEIAERLMKLSPEERQAWIKKRLEERARQAAGSSSSN